MSDIIKKCYNEECEHYSRDYTDNCKKWFLDNIKSKCDSVILEKPVDRHYKYPKEASFLEAVEWMELGHKAIRDGVKIWIDKTTGYFKHRDKRSIAFILEDIKGTWKLLAPEKPEVNECAMVVCPMCNRIWPDQFNVCPSCKQSLIDKPKYRPFTWDEREALRGEWVKCKDSGNEYCIMKFLSHVPVWICTEEYELSPKTLLNDYEFINGLRRHLSPCGVALIDGTAL